MTKLRHVFQYDLRNIPGVAPDDMLYVAAADDTHLAVMVYPADPTADTWQLMRMDYQGKIESWVDQGWPTESTWSHPRTATLKQYTWGIPTLSRGYRDETRPTDWVRPLTIMEKMALSEQFALSIAPPAMLGLAYSRSLYTLSLDHEVWVLRQVGLAYSVMSATHDYEVTELHLLHPTHSDMLETPLLDGVRLVRPTSPVCHNNLLIVTDLNEPITVYGWTITYA